MNKKALVLLFGLFFTLFCIGASAQVEQVYSSVVTDEAAVVEEFDAWFSSEEAINPRTASLLSVQVNGTDATTHNLVLDYADYASWQTSMDAATKSKDFAKLERRIPRFYTGSGEALYVRIADNGKSFKEGDYIFVIAVKVKDGKDEAYIKAFNNYMNSALAKKSPGFVRLLAARAGAEDFSHLAVFSAPTFAALNEFLDSHSGTQEMIDFMAKVGDISTGIGSSIHKVIKVWK